MDIEIICIEVMPKNAKNFIILCWYRPQTSDFDTGREERRREMTTASQHIYITSKIICTGNTNELC